MPPPWLLRLDINLQTKSFNIHIIYIFADLKMEREKKKNIKNGAPSYVKVEKYTKREKK